MTTADGARYEGQFSNPLIGSNGGDRTFLSAGCAAPYAVEVAADGVELHNLYVRGGNVDGILVEGRSGVKLSNLVNGTTAALRAPG